MYYYVSKTIHLRRLLKPIKDNQRNTCNLAARVLGHRNLAISAYTSVCFWTVGLLIFCKIFRSPVPSPTALVAFLCPCFPVC